MKTIYELSEENAGEHVEKLEENTEENTEDINSQIIQQIIHVHDSISVTEDETIHHQNPNNPLSKNTIWVLFILCILFYGFGIFIVYLPSKLYGINVNNSYSIISFGRLLGGCLVTILTTNLKQFKTFLDDSLVSIKNLHTLHTSKNLRANIFSFISPILSTLGYMTYDFLIIGGQNVSLISSLTNLYILIPIFYGIFILKDKMNMYKYVGFFLMIVAVILLGIDKNSFEDNNNYYHHNNHAINMLITVLLIILTILFWGLASVVRIYSLKRIKYSQFIYFSLLGQIFNVLMSLIQFFIQDVQISYWTLVLIAGQLSVYLGSICSVIIASDSETAKWSALTQTSSLITIVLSIIVFKDPITPLLIAGFILLVLSGVLIKKD